MAGGELGKVLIAGASGLVGREALRLCLQDPGVSEVRALTRRPLTLDDLLGPCEELTAAQRGKFCPCVVDFDRLDRHADLFDVDTVFCALGTTIRQAGSKAAFRRVDFDWPLQVARLAHAHGAQRFLLVSALGASSASRVFYNRIKGELEDALGDMDWPLLCVARPSLLQGERVEFRPGERLGLWLCRVFGALIPDSHRPVHVRQVASALLAACRVAQPDGPARRVLANAELRAML